MIHHAAVEDEAPAEIWKATGFLFLVPDVLIHDVNVAARSLAAAFFFVELMWRRSGRGRWILRQTIPGPPVA